MRIAIIGPGAMGLLYASYLSKKNDVTLVGRNQSNMNLINDNGVTVEEIDGTRENYRMTAVVDTNGLEPFELVIVFTKAGDTHQALAQHKNLIGPDTRVMTLQNGMGNEKALKSFTPDDHILIGTTKEGCYRKSPAHICHSGKGNTAFGMITDMAFNNQKIADLFSECDLPCTLAIDIKQMIWDKLMINASSSVLSGIFQVPQGCVATNEYIWNIAKKLITELCITATADGYTFSAEEQIERIYQHLMAAQGGYTSIYADLKAGRKTEVSVINGAVVDVANRLGINVPTHEMIVDIVHGMEKCKENCKSE